MSILSLPIKPLTEQEKARLIKCLEKYLRESDNKKEEITQV